MVTYMVVGNDDGDGWLVVVKETGIVVGWFATKGAALAEANLRASAMPGNRVES